MPIRDLPRGGSSRSRWITSPIVQAASSEVTFPGSRFVTDTPRQQVLDRHAEPETNSEEFILANQKDGALNSVRGLE